MTYSAGNMGTSQTLVGSRDTASSQAASRGALAFFRAKSSRLICRNTGSVVIMRRKVGAVEASARLGSCPRKKGPSGWP